MNVETGRVYSEKPTIDEVLSNNEDPNDIVEVIGTTEQVNRLSNNIKEVKKKKRKQQRMSRKKNR